LTSPRNQPTQPSSAGAGTLDWRRLDAKDRAKDRAKGVCLKTGVWQLGDESETPVEDINGAFRDILKFTVAWFGLVQAASHF
jgi:hypothetical protein